MQRSELIEAIRKTSEALSAAPTAPEPINYHEEFSKLAKHAAEAGNDGDAALLRLLAGVFSMHYKGTPGEPFGPLFEIRGKRSLLPEDLTDDEVTNLSSLVVASEDPVFIARIADVIWVRARRHEFARKAVEAYLKSAEQQTESWVPRADYLQRAAQIAMELGQRATERGQVAAKVRALFEASKETCVSPDMGFWPAQLATILIENRLISDWDTFGDACADVAAQFPLQPGCDEPRRYYELAAICYERAGQSQKARDARLAIARHWESEAQLFSDGFNTAHRIEQAIAAYRRAGGQQDKVGELLAALKDANLTALGQMKRFEIPVDVQPLIKVGRKAMTGRVGLEALRTFAGLRRPGVYSDVRARVIADAQKHPLQSIFAVNVMAEEGNVTARIPGARAGEEDNITAGVVRMYSLSQELDGATVLEAARRVLSEGEPREWEESIKESVRTSAFVPEDRRPIYERAITAGFSGDGLVFAHLVIPQIENSLRLVFQGAGLQITTIDAEGVQQERDLNQLLRDEGAKSVLGEDLVWELRSLLIEKTGPNLRNRLAHGLLASEAFDAPRMNVLLSLTVRLVIGFGVKETAPMDRGSGL